MLTCLRVRNFAIIDELEVEFSEGLNVVTGETGAGKSILIAALKLVLGGKGNADVVRTGEKSAEVEALFELEPDDVATGLLNELGLDGERELIVRRTVLASGRTRAYINGRMATAAQLSTFARGLADISSQHEHQDLADSKRHLGYLDSFANHDELVQKTSSLYAELLEADSAVRTMEQKAADRGSREDLLRFQMTEIDEIAPELGEDTALAEERERLRHAERLARAAGGAEDAIYARDDALCTSLSRIVAEVDDAAEVDTKLRPLCDTLENARTLLEDAARELGSYARDVQVDPGRLLEVEDRLDAIGRLKRKHGGSIDRVLQFRDKAAEELGELDQSDEIIDSLKRKRAELWDKAGKAALKLSDSRKRAAQKLGNAVSKELAALGMGDATVVVEVESLDGREGELEVDGARLSARGIDRAEFLIAPNRGEDAKPLRKIASGGELSRSMLAIKRVLAGIKAADLYVFDEVDAGVGGAVAEVIGKKMREVSEHHQVLCITHLAQIAVYADAHFRVEKGVVGDRTRSEIIRLTEKERAEEVARMLGGLKITKKTREAASEMLRAAQA